MTEYFTNLMVLYIYFVPLSPIDRVYFIVQVWYYYMTEYFTNLIMIYLNDFFSFQRRGGKREAPFYSGTLYRRNCGQYHLHLRGIAQDARVWCHLREVSIFT